MVLKYFRGIMSRFDYIAYDEIAKEQQVFVKEIVTNLENVLMSIDQGRSVSLALTKLEEVYMWSGKAIRDSQIERNNGADLQEQRSDS